MDLFIRKCSILQQKCSFSHLKNPFSHDRRWSNCLCNFHKKISIFTCSKIRLKMDYFNWIVWKCPEKSKMFVWKSSFFGEVFHFRVKMTKKMCKKATSANFLQSTNFVDTYFYLDFIKKKKNINSFWKPFNITNIWKSIKKLILYLKFIMQFYWLRCITKAAI